MGIFSGPGVLSSRPRSTGTAAPADPPPAPGGGGGGGGGSFTPQASTLALYDPAGQMWSDAGGTTLATADGTPIERVANQISGGNPLVRYEYATSVPIRKNSIMNGRPVLRFAPGNGLQVSGLALGAGQGKVWGAGIFRFTAADGNNGKRVLSLFGLGTTGDTADALSAQMLLRHFFQSLGLARNGASQGTGADTALEDAFAKILVIFDSVNAIIRVNGSQVLTMPSTGSFGTPATLVVGKGSADGFTGDLGLLDFGTGDPEVSAIEGRMTAVANGDA